MRKFWSDQLSKDTTRRALCAGLLLLIALWLAVHLIGRQDAQRNLDQIATRLEARSTSNAGILARQLDALRHDARFLASVPPVSGIVRASANGGYDARDQTPGALWQRRLQDIFSAYAMINPDIVQVRLIGMADQGRELVRIDSQRGKASVRPSAQLQVKGDRVYMRETARLAPGQVYISDLNLNREQGRVQSPQLAVVRAATPVHDADGKLFGIVVINYDADAILVPLVADLPRDFQAYLASAEGDFLLHPRRERSFGFDLGRRWRWQDEFRPDPAGAMAASNLHRYLGGGGAIYAAERKVALDPGKPERDLTYVLATAEAPLLAQVRLAQLVVLSALLAGGLAAGGATHFYGRQRLKVSEYQARMSAIVENSQDAIIGTALDGVVSSWNQGACAIFGLDERHALGRRLIDLLHVHAGVPREIPLAALQQRLRQGEPVRDLHLTLRRADGQDMVVSVTSTPIASARGHAIGLALTVRDISEQVAAHARVRDLNASLEQQVRERTLQIESVTILQRAILAHASYAIIATDTDGIIRLFNPAAERMLGYQAPELLGHQTPAILHERAEVEQRASELSKELGQPVAAGFEAFVIKAKLGMSNETEWTYVRKDGSTFPVSLSVSALREENGTIIGYLGMAADISNREQDRRTLVAARDQLLAAANVAELGIWTWTVASGALEWNARMFDFYDVPPDQRHGLCYEEWRSRVHPDDLPGVMNRLTDAAAGIDQYHPSFRILRRDGKIRYVQAAATVERDAHGTVLRVLGINRDITIQHEAEQAMRAATRAADAANRAKSQFLANMSHEIRSPMHAVLGMLTLLQQTGLDARQRDYAAKAERAGRALLGILNDILDFSRVEAGKLSLDPQPFSISQVLREVGVVLSANLGEKPLALRYELEPGLPDQVVGDAMRLRQILINLGGNAIKFTPHGEVVVAAGVLPPAPGDAPSDDATLRLVFSVRDSGIGISPEQCARIFDGFSQAEASTARRYGGSGLGLAICQRLVALMHGTLTVDSAVGVGSTFRFSILCKRAPPGALPAPGMAPPCTRQDAPARVRPLAGLRLLLVEDHPVNQQVARELLSHDGALVDVADNGAAALAALRAAPLPYDAVLMDVQMPGMDGYQATRAIRNDLGLHLPIIAMTANAMLSDREEALQAGMNDHIGKPFDLPQLVATVLRHTGRARGGVAELIPAAQERVGGAPPGFNDARALARFGGNLPAYQRALRQFAREGGALAAAVPALLGEEGWRAACAALHTLKGLAGTVGAEDLAELARGMELLARGRVQSEAWAEQHAKLMTAIRLAMAGCQELAGQLEVSPPARDDEEQQDLSALPEALTRLQRLLEASNLDALPLYAELQHDYGRHMQPQFDAMEKAIEAFNFALAAQQCGAMLLRLGAAEIREQNP